MATNMYGIDSRLWAQMSPEDQNQVIAEYNRAHSVSYSPPTIGGYVQPTPEQVQTAVQQSGLPPDSQQTVIDNYTQATAPPPPAPSAEQKQNPPWVVFVNAPSTYPDFAAMKAAGTGLIVVDTDPNAAMLAAAAREWGIPVGVHVWADPGSTPEQYAAKVSYWVNLIHPDLVDANIETPGKGYAGSAATPDQSMPGWEWSAKVAPLLKQAAGGTPIVVGVMGNQDDFNYKAYQDIGIQAFWVETYAGDMTTGSGGVQHIVDRVVANGVPASMVVPIIGPQQDIPGAGPWISYGIPGTSAGGIYSGSTQAVGGPNASGVTASGGVSGGTAGSGTSAGSGSQLTPVGGNTTPAHGIGGAPAIPGEIPETGPTPPGSPAPPGSGLPGAPPGTSSGTGSTANADNTNWAAAYFASFGLPPDVAAKVNEIFKKYPDTDQAIQFALAYIRGTPWYAQTFPGIQYGMQHGLVSNEQEYRQYVTGIDTLAQRYLGRHISGGEITDYLYNGVTPEIVGKQYEGTANLAANYKDYFYYTRNFGDQDLQNLDTDSYRALANEQVGLDSPLGQRLNKALQTAMQRAQKAFEGQTATPSLSLQNGLSSPSLLGRAQKPDVAA